MEAEGAAGDKIDNRPPYMSEDVDAFQRELESLDEQLFPHAMRFLRDAIEKAQSPTPYDPEYLVVDQNKAIRIARKVVIPVDKHPNFNFVGKLLGPGGRTLQELSANHKCKIFIFGKGSIRDESKEAELFNSGDSKYKHFAERLHVKVETIGPPQRAYERIAGVLNELEHYLQPVRDEIVDGQLQQMSGGAGGRGRGGDRGRGMPPGRGGPMRGRGGPPAPRYDMGNRGGYNGMSRGGGGYGPPPPTAGGYGPPPVSYPPVPPAGGYGAPPTDYSGQQTVSYPDYYYTGAQAPGVATGAPPVAPSYDYGQTAGYAAPPGYESYAPPPEAPVDDGYGGYGKAPPSRGRGRGGVPPRPGPY